MPTPSPLLVISYHYSVGVRTVARKQGAKPVPRQNHSRRRTLITDPKNPADSDSMEGAVGIVPGRGPQRSSAMLEARRCRNMPLVELSITSVRRLVSAPLLSRQVAAHLSLSLSPCFFITHSLSFSLSLLTRWRMAAMTQCFNNTTLLTHHGFTHHLYYSFFTVCFFAMN